MFLRRRFYIVMVAIAAVFAAAMVWPALFAVGRWLIVVFALAVAADAVTLYGAVRLSALRNCAQRFSMGDSNDVEVVVKANSPVSLDVEMVDELPCQLQQRDFNRKFHLAKNARHSLKYQVRPVTRGEYLFGNVLLFASTPLGLLQRRFKAAEPATVKVYPSFVKLKNMELMASSAMWTVGSRRIRRPGNSTEFEQIRDYVQGDDYRTINWKASARRSRLMVNAYQDEQERQIFSLIDKGRLMQQSSEGMSMLDYSINSALMLSYVAVSKHDRVGLITFDSKMGAFVPAENKTTQMATILDALYNVNTTFGESDYSMLSPNVTRLVPRRSLMVLYTNFTDYNSLTRQLPYLRLLNRSHRLLVVFFEDVELDLYVEEPQHTILDYYQHIVAEKLTYERRLIPKTLRQNGIYSLLTTPQSLSVDVVNKYLEMKTMQLLV